MIDPQHVPVGGLLQQAQLAMRRQRPDDAAHLLRRASDLDPDNPIYRAALGELYLETRCYQEALVQFKRAARLQPDNAGIYFGMGIASDALGYHERAVQCYRQAVLLEPNWSQAWYNLGCTLMPMERFHEAAAAFEQAVTHRPDWSPAWTNLGCALNAQGSADQAMACWQKAIHLNDASPTAHYQCGCYHQDRKDFKRAEQAFKQTLQHAPKMIAARVALAVCLQKQGDLDGAAANYRKAMADDPSRKQAGLRLAEVNIEQNRMDAVIAVYQQMLAHHPDDHEVHYNLAIALSKKWRLEEAVAHCRKALEIHPDFTKALSGLVRLAQHGCDWALEADLAPVLDRLTSERLNEGKKPDEEPFFNLHRHADPKINLAVARAWSNEVAERAAELDPKPVFEHNQASHGGPIRIGYLSGDFKDHAMAYHIRGLLRAHDRRRFRIYGYAANRDNGTPYRQELIRLCDAFIPIHDMDDIQAAERIYRDRIDILVDLSGHTHGNRMGVLALRPAPVQVGYLGFLGTSGAECIDYFITDAVVTPPRHAPYYTEKLVFLPHCYQVNDDALEISTQPLIREQMGLPPDQVVFCCFNQSHKINRFTFDAWMRILAAVPHSVLWLLDQSLMATTNLRREVAARGIDPRRLIFSGAMKIDMHLARLRLADIALDTFTYNGGATTANALWAGVPLIALLGTHLVSRMSASALLALGIPELVTRTPDAYCAKAIELGRDPRKRATLKRRLALNIKRTPLFDTRLFTSHVEAAYTTMVERFRRGSAPAAFKIQPDGSHRPLEQEEWEEAPVDLAALARAAQRHVDNGQLDAAAEVYEQMVRIAPDRAELHHMLGLVHLDRHQWDMAQQRIQHAIDLAPGNAGYARSMGDLLAARNDPAAANKAYQRAVALSPEDRSALIGLGNTFYALSQTDQARRQYEALLAERPDDLIALNNLGKIYFDQREIPQALCCYEKALRIDPNYAEARFNRAVALLLSGDYQNGFEEFEWRFRRKRAKKVYPHQLTGPRWRKAPFRRQRLLVHCEQGLGDVLQFVRFLPVVKALGGSIILEVQEALMPVLSCLDTVDQLVPFSAQRPTAVEYDYHIPLMSLPRVLKTTLDTIPNQVPYLQVDADMVGSLRGGLPADGFKVGLVWSCSKAASYRESKLAYMQPLLALPGVHWYSLQKGPEAAQIECLPRHLAITPLVGERLDDFSDTAAATAAVDLLISVDTSVVHMAGALGVPVWVLLPYSGDWRWLLDRDDSPWYPSARLFRQSRPGDWMGLIERVRQALCELLPPRAVQ